LRGEPDAYGYTNRHSDRLANCDCNGDRLANSDSYLYSDSFRHGYRYRHLNAYGNGYFDAYGNGYFDAYCHRDGNSYSCTNRHGHGHGCTNRYGHGHGDSYCDRDGNSYRHCDGDANRGSGAGDQPLHAGSRGDGRQVDDRWVHRHWEYSKESGDTRPRAVAG
jgi:hypothetical protein